MYEEGQLYSPVTQGEGGQVTVHLADDHPGANDPEYRERRNEIAAAALAWHPGEPAPAIEYTRAEQEVWQTVCRELRPKYERLAIREFNEGVARLRLPTDHVPSLDEVSANLEPLTGFRYVPAAGLVPLREFYGSLEDRVFLSTQYVRHPSVPLYTPEPDIIHEVIGHANFLASERMADLYQAAGQASLRTTTEAALAFFSRVFWFSIEFGVLWEGGELRTYGSGILSSFGELDHFREADIRPFDLRAMGTQDYDISVYQPVLFAARSFDHAVNELQAFFTTYDDERFSRLYAPDAA